MDDIRFQIKMPGYEEQEEEGGKKSKVSKKPKEDKSSKRSKKGKTRPPRTAAERCDHCCYCCVLCCESVFFTIGSAIRILLSVAVVGLMFWTALYVYTIISKDDKKASGGSPTGNGSEARNSTEDSRGNGSGILRGLDGYSNLRGSSDSLIDPEGLEANDGLPDSSGDFLKLDSCSGDCVRRADSDNGSDSPRDPGGGSDDSGAASGSSESHRGICSDKSCPNDACDSRGVPSNPVVPGNVVDTSNRPGNLGDSPGDLVDSSGDLGDSDDSGDS